MGFVTDISVSQVGRFLQEAAVQPHRKKMWLNTTEKDPQKFRAEFENRAKEPDAAYEVRCVINVG